MLPMWVADMDFRSPPCVVEALTARIQHGVFGYTKPSAGLTEATLQYLLEHHRWHVEAEWLVWLNGLVPALNLACCAAGNPGDGVLVPTPVYTPFVLAPRNSKRTLVSLPLLPPEHNDSEWQLDWAAMRAAVASPSQSAGGGKPVAFLLCNPHNPTGHCWSENTLRELGQFCVEHELLLCSDEVHADLILDPSVQHVPVASLSPEIANTTISLFAASKTYNTPGLCCAYAVIPSPKIRSRFRRAMRGMLTEVSAPGFVATEAAYRAGEPWRLRLLSYLRGNRAALLEGIAASPVLRTAIRVSPASATCECTPPRGVAASLLCFDCLVLCLRLVGCTDLAWIDIRGLEGLDSTGAEQLFRRHGVGVLSTDLAPV